MLALILPVDDLVATFKMGQDIRFSSRPYSSGQLASITAHFHGALKNSCKVLRLDIGQRNRHLAALTLLEKAQILLHGYQKISELGPLP